MGTHLVRKTDGIAQKASCLICQVAKPRMPLSPTTLPFPRAPGGISALAPWASAKGKRSYKSLAKCNPMRQRRYMEPDYEPYHE